MYSYKRQPAASLIAVFEENGKEHLIMLAPGLVSVISYLYRTS